MDESTREATAAPHWQPLAHLACALGGLGLLTAGAALVYRPAGLIVPGLLLLAGAVVGALRSRS